MKEKVRRRLSQLVVLAAAFGGLALYLLVLGIVVMAVLSP